MRITTLLSVFLFCLPSWGQMEIPQTSNTYEIIQHQYYSLGYSEPHEQAAWVAYELTAQELAGNTARTDNFRPDPKVSTGSAQLDDYKGSGYDRGHLAPAADMKVNATAMSESFYLSNMSPQSPGFNSGIWKNLESLVRNWALNEGSIYIVTGPILTDNLSSIGYNGVSIPQYYYKVILTGSLDKAIGFVMPNAKSSNPLKYYAVTIDSVETITGLDFFSELPDDKEEALESQCKTRQWDFTSSNTSKSYSSSSSSTATQCKGIAKSTGVRCKKMTTNPNGYCHYHQAQASSTNIKASTTPSGRCQATTQAGTQCKRQAEPGSKYCWQHQK